MPPLSQLAKENPFRKHLKSEKDPATASRISEDFPTIISKKYSVPNAYLNSGRIDPSPKWRPKIQIS